MIPSLGLRVGSHQFTVTTASP
ncbi:UNVERIFIED_CONTAM: hypothetical protein GTU68_003535 [Idotea baltica]|nr:hypothetical protein [Idotea baltica]